MRSHLKSTSRHQKLDQAGFIRHTIALGVVLATCLIGINIHRVVADDTTSSMPEVRSGIAGYCLDDHHDGGGANAVVNAWACNGTAAQNWTVTDNTIKHDNFGCLSVQNNTKTSGSKVVLNNCDGSPGQVWTVDLGGFQNPNSGMCLTVPASRPQRPLVIAACNDLSQLNQAWAASTWSNSTGSSVPCDAGTKGQRVACYAERQWVAWQSGSLSHKTLLVDYTDGNAYEEWCADFVSYVYREAGYPFTQGERSGWDEYDANNIQNMGFTWHVASGYDPQPGDVAFFDYSAGHVEIVATGGKHPTFIYGNSGTIDPATGNGEMNEDSLTQDGSAGQVVYYLSPN